MKHQLLVLRRDRADGSCRGGFAEQELTKTLHWQHRESVLVALHELRQPRHALARALPGDDVKQEVGAAAAGTKQQSRLRPLLKNETELKLSCTVVIMHSSYHAQWLPGTVVIRHCSYQAL